MTAAVRPIPPSAGLARVTQDGKPAQPQIDFERALLAYLDYLYTLSSSFTVPFPTPTTLGGVKSSTAPTHQFQTGIDTGGNATYAQPVAADISGLGSLATANTVAVGSITGLGALATLSSVNLATQVTGNLAVSHLNSGIDASSSTYLRGDGTWAAVTAAPGGSSGQIQYNNAGLLSGFTVTGDGTLDATSGNLIVTKTNGVAFGSLATLSTVNNSNWSGTALSIGNGGTGQTTKAAAFDALSPLTSVGDLVYGGVAGTGTRLAVGTTSQVLIGGTVPSWGSVSNAMLTNSTISGISLGSSLATLTIGTHLTGTAYNGSGAVTIATDATSSNVVSTLVARDSSGNFSAGTITASLTGHASADLQASNNLSDLGSASSARANLVLGTSDTVRFGSLGLGVAPSYLLDVRNSTEVTQAHFSGTGNDEGLYITGLLTNSGYFSGGAEYNGTNWVAKNTTAQTMAVGAGTLLFYSDSGLTIGNTFTPTLRWEIDSTGTVAVGTVPAARTSGFAAVATSGSATDITTGTLPAAQLPTPTSTTLGGVKSSAAAAKNFATGIDTTGAVQYAQPSASSLSDGTTGSGKVVLAAGAVVTNWGLGGATSGSVVLKAPAVAGSNTLTFPAGTTDFSSTGGTHQVVQQTSSGGAFTVGQLAAADISGLATSATTDTTNAINITSGTLAVANGGTGDTGTGWTSYTPTVTAGSGTITTVGTHTGSYKTLGKTVFMQADVTITTNGTGASSLVVSLPFSVKSGKIFIYTGREQNVTGALIVAQLSGANASLVTTASGYPAGDGYRIVFSAVYEST